MRLSSDRKLFILSWDNYSLILLSDLVYKIAIKYIGFV